MATGQTDKELLLALMRNPGVIPNLDPFTYPQNAPNVPKEFGQEVLEFAQALERNPNRRATGLEEVVELIGKMAVINPLKTAGSLMQLDKPTVERMAQSGVEAVKRAYDDPPGTASRLAQGAKEALLDPVGTAGELSVSDVAGGSGLLSKLAGAANLTGPALMAAMVPGSDVPRPKPEIKDPTKIEKNLVGKTDIGQVAATFKADDRPIKTFEPGSRVVDFGGGKADKAKDFMAEQNVELLVIDPFNRSASHNSAMRKELENKLADYGTINNVLNVIEDPDLRKNALLDLSTLTKPNAPIIIKIFPGDGTGKGGLKQSGTWQENRKTETYLEEVQQVFPDAQKVAGDYIVATNNFSKTTSNPNVPKQADLKQFFVEQGGVRVPLPDKNFGVGKKIGNDLYVHKSAEDVIPVDILNNARRLIGDFPYDVVKYNKKDNSISFIESPNFDTSPEPIIGNSIKVNADGSVSKPRKGGNVIYHHKWNMVRPDYDGFDYNESMLRSAQWTSALEGTGINRNKIGNKNYWDSNVLPLLGKKKTRSEELMQEQLDRGETLSALERERLEGQMTLGPDDARARQAALVQASDEIDEKVKVGILTKDEAKAKKAPLIEEFLELNKILHEGGPEYRLRMARLDVDDSRRQLSALNALDDVEKARLDRAVQQGFNLDAFHGTKGDITEFDPGLLGVTTGAESARKGFFFSADPETAALYADLADAEKLDKKRYESFFADENSEYFDAEISNKKEQIQRAKSLGDKNAVKYLEEELQDFELEKKDYLERQVRKRDIGGGLGENIMPVKLQITNPFVRDFEGSSYREFSYNDLLKKARNEGHDGAIFRNTIDGNAITDVYVVFEPEQIKSRFATFDPEKTGSKDILASVPPVLFPLGVGAAAASYSANKEE